MKFLIFNRFLYIILLAVFIFSTLSCEKILEVSPPSTQLSRTNVFNTDASANAAILGIYSQLSANGFASGSNYSITYLCGLSSDELNDNSQDPNQTEFFLNSLTSQNPSVSTLWSDPYKYIYYCNSILESIPATSPLSVDLKNQIIGEALFIRSFCYFYLVNLFGDVPLVLTTDFEKSTSATREPKSGIYGQLINDLIKAKNLMYSDYSNFSGQKSRPNKYAAEALLARVYLYTDDFENAEVAASDIIKNASLYKLEDSLNHVFLKNSSEAIWQLDPVVANYTNEAVNFIITDQPNKVSLSKSLLDSFKPGDLRKEKWISSFKIADTSYYFPFKYRQAAANSDGTESSMVLRLAEQFLIRAESRYRLGKVDGADGSLADINTIRVRSGLARVTSLTSEQLLKEIQYERQMEFLCEWGHRWLDLKRFNSSQDNERSLADDVLPAVKPIQWLTTSKLYPIPQIQLQNDPNMKDEQNPGYN